jgi:cytochrome c oxidase subunit II
VVDTRQQYDELFSVYLPIAGAVFVLVLVLLLFVVLRFRSSDERPVSGRSRAKVAESVYAGLLACIAAFLVYLTFSVMAEQESGAPARTVNTGQVESRSAPAIDIDVTAARWNWRFDYPRYGITQVGTGNNTPTLVVPVGNVRFALTSIDVVHSFFMPEQRYKRDAFPERFNRFTLGFDRPAFIRGGGKCAEYCGLRHSYMEFNVRVLDQADFERWAQAKRAAESGRPPA